MSQDDRLTQLLLAVCWPVSTAFNRCPVRATLWGIGLARAELDQDVARAAFRLLDYSTTRDRC